ncbi:hypothetical protein H9Y04_10345 [Streptomyces sp. TRM66268-LWL]|uniref:Uncharacterized protein n=1 Tax=Streptomyces polyasparticus TaxID=2767826 RepID=A0ABR7SC24_9ACTN|nr:hypothetical protein [Streptomyces polyasparticus]MBC9712968.1 hypothetical protein [Streptomyces polyasparticus]
MSDHCEVVFSCFLRDDTPESVLAALRWHLGLAPERPAHLDPEWHPYPLLEPDPDSWLPGGDTASLRRQSTGFTAEGERYAWGLFSRNHWLDDDLGYLVTVLELLAPHVEPDEDGFGGWFRYTHEAEQTPFVFRDGTYHKLGG